MISNKPPVPMPSAFKISDEGPSFVMKRRWFSFSTIGLTVFALFWDSFLIFWYTTAITKSAPAAALWFPLVHVAVGFVVSYIAAAGFVNSTRITIDALHVTVAHGPLPWIGNRSLSRAEIKQFFCERQMRRTKHGVRYSYHLKVMDQFGTISTFVGNLENMAQARFIEQELEKRLGITDIALPEEAA